MSGRPFSFACREAANGVIRRYGTATHAPTTATSGIRARKSGTTDFMACSRFVFEELEAKNAHAGQRFQQDEREYFYAEAELSSDEPSRATRSIQQFGESPHPDGGRATASAATRSFSCDGPRTRLVRMR
jgi:hypothetical protein